MKQVKLQIYLLLSTDTSMITPHVDLSVLFLVNLALQYQQPKRGFWSAWTVSMWSLKFCLLANAFPHIVQWKRSGLLECCCRTRHCILIFSPKVKAHHGHCTRCSVVPHCFLWLKKRPLLNFFPHVGQVRGYVMFGMIKKSVMANANSTPCYTLQ